MRGVGRYLPANQRMGVETEVGLAKGATAFFGNFPHLLRVEVYDFEKAIAGFDLPRISFLETEKHFIPQRPQA